MLGFGGGVGLREGRRGRGRGHCSHRSGVGARSRTTGGQKAKTGRHASQGMLGSPRGGGVKWFSHVVLEQEAELRVVQKLKLVGTPHKVNIWYLLVFLLGSGNLHADLSPSIPPTSPLLTHPLVSARPGARTFFLLDS